MWLTAGAGVSFLLSKMMGKSGAGSLLLTCSFTVMGYVIALLIPLVVGIGMQWVAPLFGARRSWVHSYRVLVYAVTPLYVAGLLGVIPVFGILTALLAFPWALILLYLGIGRVLEVRGARQLLLTATTLVLSIVAAVLPMSAMALLPGRHHATEKSVSVPMELSDEAKDMSASMKVQSGQADEADIQRAAESYVKEMVSTGQIKPDEETNAKKSIVQSMREANAAAKGAPTSQGN
jgi:hypothetical protein